jgi:DNA mismatch endonuclease (patch repair protein)
VPNLSQANRSRIMSSIRKTNTSPEVAVRRELHRLGFRFRLNVRELPGTPDIVLPRLRKIVMVHGCFWHQHSGCRLAKLPRTRPEYWLPKLERNQARDEAARRALAALGWEVLVIWECEAGRPEYVRGALVDFLQRADINK